MLISGRSTQIGRMREKNCEPFIRTVSHLSAIPHGESANCIGTVADFGQPSASSARQKSASQKSPLDAPAPADRLHRSIGPRTHGHPRYYVENIRSKSLVRLNGNKRQIPNHRCHAPPIAQICSAGVDFSPYRHAQLLNRFFFRLTTATASCGLFAEGQPPRTKKQPFGSRIGALRPTAALVRPVLADDRGASESQQPR